VKAQIPGHFHLVPWFKLSPSFSLSVLSFLHGKDKIHRHLGQWEEEEIPQNSK